jgi:Leucine rich repeat
MIKFVKCSKFKKNIQGFFSRKLVKCLILATFSIHFVSSELHITCEKTSLTSWPIFDSIKVSRKTCWIQTKPIDSAQLTISSAKDDTVTALTFFLNKNAFYLPNKVSEAFPKLDIYGAANCSIKEIFKRNFDGLVELTYLQLQENQIERISSSTFKGLKSLKFLSLRKFTF